MPSTYLGVGVEHHIVYSTRSAGYFDFGVPLVRAPILSGRTRV